MATYTKKSREDIKEEIDVYNQKIIDIGESFKTDPELITEYLAFASRFYDYSVKNQKLIFAQNPHAVFVGSFQSFKNKGYSVKKGQTGLKIFVPVETTYFYRGKEKIKLIDATKDEKEKIKNKMIKTNTELHFKLGTVFDISQTNCPVSEYPKIFYFGEASTDHQKVYEILKEQFNNQGMSIDEGEINSLSLRGYYIPEADEIKINEKLEDTERLSTLIHEISHKLLEHNHYEKELDVSQKEFEADALSVMINSRLGLETTEGRKEHLSSNYRSFIKYHDELNEADRKNYSVDDSFKKVNKIFKKEMEAIERNLDKDTNINQSQVKDQTVAKNQYRHRADKESNYEMER